MSEIPLLPGSKNPLETHVQADSSISSKTSALSPVVLSLTNTGYLTEKHLVLI